MDMRARKQPAKIPTPLKVTLLATTLFTQKALAIAIGDVHYDSFEEALEAYREAYVDGQTIEIEATDSDVIAVSATDIDGVAIDFETGTTAKLLIDVAYPQLGPSLHELPVYDIGGISVQGSNDPELVWNVIDVTGGDANTKFKLFWTNQDAKYYENWFTPNDLVNRIGVKIGNLYAQYLDDGGRALLDIVQTKIGTTADYNLRRQTLHDNILGNISDVAIADRFVEDPRSPLARTYGLRQNNDGKLTGDLYTKLGDARSALEWDLEHGIDYFDALPAEFGNTIVIGTPDAAGPKTLFTDISAAVNAAVAGDTIRVSAGTFTQANTLNLDVDNLTLTGAGVDKTTIVSQSSGYGIDWSGDGISVSNFSYQGPSADAGSSYGFKIQPQSGASAPVKDVEIINVAVYGSGRAEIDLHYVDGALIQDVTADGENTQGAGIQLTASEKVVLDNVTTRDNLWGSVAVYTKPGANHDFTGSPPTSSNVTITNLTYNEAIALFGEGNDQSPDDATRQGLIPGLAAPQFTHIVRNDAYRADAGFFTHYRPNLADAAAFAAGLNTVGTGKSIIKELSSGKFIVRTGMKIQTTVDVAAAGDTIDIAGEFTEATVTLNKGLTLNGNGAAKLTGKIDITASDVTVTGMEITNPGATWAIQAKGASNLEISENWLHHIGTTVSGSAQGVYIYGTTTTAAASNISITDNLIEYIGNNGTTSSAKGIYVGDSNAAQLLSDVVISGNTIKNVAVLNTGAYGISVNYGVSGTGSVSGLAISDNVIDGVSGKWVHGIGLETKTASTSVTGNTVKNLAASEPDEAAIFFEGNTEAASVVIRNNKLEGGLAGVALHAAMPDGIVVDARNNWWGSATSPAGRVSPNVTFSPWYVSADLSALSSDAADVEITAQPGSAVAGTAITPAPSVLVTDYLGNPVSGVNVTAQLGGGGTLGGTTSVVTGADGKATFSNLIVSSEGNFTLTFKVGTVTSEATTSFTVTAPAPEPTPAPAPTPTPPPTPTQPPLTDTIDEIISTIDIPVPGTSDELSEETITAISQAAETTDALAQSVIENIDEVDTDAAVDALSAISAVVDVTASAANATGSGTQPSQSTAVVDSGTKALNSLSSVLTAIDSKTNNPSAPAVPLSQEQKNEVQQATVKAAAAAVQILRAAEPEKKQEVLQTLGKIITSNVNLGVPLTTAQTDALLQAADQAASAPNTTGPIGVEVKPVNKGLISKDLLLEELAGTGIGEEELDSFLADLAGAIDPADVRIGNVDGETALEEGINESIGGTSISFDKQTGTIVFTFFTPPPQDTQALGLRRSFAQTLERNIPARVVSSNIVASTFPDGLTMRADGSVVITSQRIASIVVPASHDPINLFADLRSLGTVSVDATGNVTIVRPGVLHFSGTFDFIGVTTGGAPAEKTTLTPSGGGNASDPNFVYTVTYRDGSQQTIQPFIAADDFIKSVTGRGLDVAIARNTGVITVEGMRFRPSYFVDEHDTLSRAWWNMNKDASGLAYRIVDANNDGLPDYEVLSETGVQVAYRLP